MKSLTTSKSKFKTFRRGLSDLATSTPVELIKTGFLGEPEILPLVIEPNIADVDLSDWAASNREYLDDLLFKYGALLFRGFSVESVAEFESFATAIWPELFGEYGDLPSEDEGKKVYHSTPYPPDKTILFHNESSHMHCWPMKQWFYCVKPSEQRGETPIVDCRKIYQSLDHDIRDLLEEKGLTYVRTFLEGLDVSWQQFFMTEDKGSVEEYCQRSDIEFKWLEGGGLKTSQSCPAIVRHPRTNEKSFFNQVQLHHVSFLEPEVRQSLSSIYGEENLPRNVYLGDGTPIPDEVMARIGELYWENSVQFTWQKGDIVMVDNMLVAHARNPYVGERKIVVAMGQMINKEDVVQAN